MACRGDERGRRRADSAGGLLRGLPGENVVLRTEHDLLRERKGCEPRHLVGGQAGHAFSQHAPQRGLRTRHPQWMIRTLLADDQALVRAGFAALLDDEPDIEVVAEAADGAEAVCLSRQHTPDVVLMDVRMPGVDGLGATKAITGDPGLRAVRVVMLTTFEFDEYLVEALRLGASGFLVKDTEPAELLHAVRVVAAGDALLSPHITRQLIARFAGTAAPPAPKLDILTDREREIMVLVAGGLSNEDIAGRLHLSTATIKTHVNRTMTKLGARDRAQLVVSAYESGLVRPGWAG